MNLYIEWAVMRWLKEHGADANAALVRKALAECDEWALYYLLMQSVERYKMEGK